MHKINNLNDAVDYTMAVAPFAIIAFIAVVGIVVLYAKIKFRKWPPDNEL